MRFSYTTYVIATTAILSFWMWLYTQNKYTKVLFGSALALFIGFISYTFVDYVHYNEGVTDELVNKVNMLFEAVVQMVGNMGKRT